MSEEALASGRGQGGRRLVEDDERASAAERLRDLDQLPLARRAGRSTSVPGGTSSPTSPRRLRACATRSRGAVHEGPAPGQGVEEQVLGDAEVREEVQLLVDERDPARRRPRTARGRVGLAREAHRACVRRQHAAEHVHERRLARAVLADQAEHAARAEGELTPSSTRHAEEGLLDPDELEERGAGRGRAHRPTQPLAQRVEHGGGEDHAALHHQDREARQAEQVQAVVDERDEEDAEDGPRTFPRPPNRLVPPITAAADHVEEDALAEHGRARLEARRVEDGGDGRAQAAGRVGEDEHPLDRHAGDPRGPRVAADRVEPAAEDGPAQQQVRRRARAAPRRGGTGGPARAVPPRARKPAGRPEMPCERVSQIAKPLANVITASVARNGGMRRRGDRDAVDEPDREPDGEHGRDRRAARGLPARTPPLSVITRAPATLASAIIAVTDRSIPPVTRTRVWPSATARSGRRLEKTLPRLAGEAKPGTSGASGEEVGDAQRAAMPQSPRKPRRPSHAAPAFFPRDLRSPHAAAPSRPCCPGG